MNWKSKLKCDPVPWLLESNPWTKYKTLTDILDLPVDSDEVMNAKNELLNDERIISLSKEAEYWFPKSITRHDKPDLSHYKLMMLADFGLKKNDLNINKIIKKAEEHYSGNLFQIRQTLPEKGKGFAKPDPDADQWHAVPCDSPLITYSLIKFGINNMAVKDSVNRIKEKWNSSKGWFCNFFFVEGMFKKLQIGCPMAGLMVLALFSINQDLKESEYAKNAYESLKFHKEYGKSVYYFGRSNKFWTFKYPFVWYNALYMADVLSRFDSLKYEELVKELIDWIIDGQDEKGRYKPTSMFRIYKNWDFGNKKESSPWITFLCLRILKRYFS